MEKNPLTKQTVANQQSNTTTFKTTIPALIRDVLEIENKDKLNWELHPETRTVTLTKVEETKPVKKES